LIEYRGSRQGDRPPQQAITAPPAASGWQHRDIKPQNMLVGGGVKVADWRPGFWKGA
jgi:hypothetical protein